MELKFPILSCRDLFQVFLLIAPLMELKLKNYDTDMLGGLIF